MVNDTELVKNVRLGESVEFKCHGEGNIIPYIRWERNCCKNILQHRADNKYDIYDYTHIRTNPLLTHLFFQSSLTHGVSTTPTKLGRLHF